MSDTDRKYEIRCPIYGFIELNEWERDIINHFAFQRLRRIRQLAWTDYVYPGAMHTRFEHSLGVMHMASLLYDGIVERSKDVLKSELGYNEDGFKRYRAFVRIAALLHDVGHAPFSHASEELFPKKEDGNPFKHEKYSAEIIRQYFSDILDRNPNYGFNTNDIANSLEGKSEAKNYLFWLGLIDGQFDADRMDYLLRDSLHAGVNYGRFDWRRLVNTVVVVPGVESNSRDADQGRISPRIGVSEGGWHAVEGLILARYFMFTQIYFHKTRVIYDHHLCKALSVIIPNRVFPLPTKDGLKEYLAWDDWKVLGCLSEGKGGEHGRRLRERDHYREIVHTPETPTIQDQDILDEWRNTLGSLITYEGQAKKSYYKLKNENDIQIVSETKERKVLPLSKFSSVVASIQPINKVSLYVKKENVDEAEERLKKIGGDQI